MSECSTRRSTPWSSSSKSSIRNHQPITTPPLYYSDGNNPAACLTEWVVNVVGGSSCCRSSTISNNGCLVPPLFPVVVILPQLGNQFPRSTVGVSAIQLTIAIIRGDRVGATPIYINMFITRRLFAFRCGRAGVVMVELVSTPQ